MRKSDCESKILNSVRSISALAWKVFRGRAVRTVRCVRKSIVPRGPGAETAGLPDRAYYFCHKFRSPV